MLPIIEPELLMLAYRSGIFPMSDARDDPEIFWIEPRLRAILPLDGFHLSHSLARTLRRGRFEVTCNTAFDAVMDACAAPRGNDDGGSWISHRIQASYERLHALGHAHSIECWMTDRLGDRRLVGGLYGVGFDRVFCGESMFSRATDASKIALAWLVAALRQGGATLLDCQFITPHLASLGAVEIPQKRYLALLKEAQVAGAAGGAALADGTGAGDGAGAAVGEAEGAGAGAVLALPKAFGALLAEAAGAGLSSSPGKLIAHFLTQTS
ncbi:leucyl/phenylalanyl-tRNA--protein transferase [Novosphingobium album (ex Liu et al. 2023)]|uniref:Leucyl/phenylalanyl-tRNA--protein transferase n=1 Tax=Novosphingobium album (ex Liu et al. 2023) TaxID=3031130 RepID=A0ABT5WRM8_9SPHN|nr:leucyl/phenylalanyl-tRNA--protein transferase [Novosphingobium album (ex Liu et al. 2023)]MDE8652701.1 leucyl/phenylalanyl-tRNA--protein transferase [Novosphingobium album (ex Liu et al. 2023)]